jgi:1-acyl-sn-glycerol-3-phosphate acyltransferase
MKSMRLLRNIPAYLLAFLLIGLFYIPVLVATGLCRRGTFMYALSRHSFKIMLKITGVRVRVRGSAGIDFSRPMVMVCNHLSNLDGPLLFSVLPCNPRALVKSEARKIPLIGLLLKLAGFVFVDRESPPRRQEALDEVVDKIKNKHYSFLVFPEGTRNRDGQTGSFKKGGFKMALAAGVPVLPIRISGSGQLLPPGKMIVKAGTVDIEVFSPLSMAGLREADLPEWIRGLQEKIYRGKDHENH